MNRAYLDIAPELLTEIVKGWSGLLYEKCFKVTKNPLPKDVMCVGCTINRYDGSLRLELESEFFEKEDEILPPVWLETVKCPEALSQL